MGANDAAEMLESAKAECVRLERENADLKVSLDYSRRLGLAAIFLADAIGVEELTVEAQKLQSVLRRDAVLAAADWLEAVRHETWNAGERRPSNYGRAASDLRSYAHRTHGQGDN